MLIDNAEQTRKLKETFWDRMWKFLYTGEDVDVEAVMEELGSNQDGYEPEGEEDKAAAAKAFLNFSQIFLDDHDED
jgi:hypothetical protein